MLILGRRVGQTLMIGDDIEIFLLGINGFQARLGINAPSNVSVHRKEIWQRIRDENLSPEEIKENLAQLSGLAREQQSIDFKNNGNV